MVATVSLALLAAACFGAQTLLVRRGLDADDGASALSGAVLTLVTSALVLWTVVTVRRGVPTVPPAALLGVFVLAGTIDPGFARLCYFEGIDRMGPTVPAAITAANPAVATLFAVAALGSRPAPADFAGLGLVVGGVAVLQLVRPTEDADRGVAVQTGVIRRELLASTRRDLLFPLVATAAIAASSVVAKSGLDAFGDALTATAVAQTAALLVLVPVAASSGSTRTYVRSPSRASAAAFGASGIVVAVGWYAMFLALGGGTVVAVLPVVSTYPLVVLAGACVADRVLPRSPVLLGAVLAIVLGTIAVQV